MLATIGFFGPGILFGMAVYTLWSTMWYNVYVYVVGYILTIVMNNGMKRTFQQRRPMRSVYISYWDSDLGADRFGMPSCHAQLNAYTALFFVRSPTASPVLMLSIYGITVLTLGQRWWYNRHTFSQLVVGLLIGVFCGAGARAVVDYI